MQLKVIKTGGITEEYLQTKVLATITNALDLTDQGSTAIAENITEAVTYSLYQRKRPLTVSSNEIFSVITAALDSTGYQSAAIAIKHQRLQRSLNRDRITVISTDITNLEDIPSAVQNLPLAKCSRWDKSIIVRDLVSKGDLSMPSARAVASMVEEKIFNLAVPAITTALIRQLVLIDTAAIMHAEQQLFSTSENLPSDNNKKNNTDQSKHLTEKV